MSTELEGGVTYDPPQKIAKAASTDYEMVDTDDQVHATAEIVVALPLNPRLGQDHLLVASGGDITIDPNGNSISGSTNVPQGTAVRVVFDVAFEWVVYAGAGGGGGGVPSPPNRAFQFDDAGVFGAATWHFEANDANHATADFSSITQDDNGTGNTLTVYEHLVNPPGGFDPPGPAFSFGSNAAFDANTMPTTIYIGASTFLEFYTDPGGTVVIDLYDVGAVFNGNPAITNPGVLIRPNLILQGFDQDPTDDKLGGGQGVFFFARAQVEPTTPPTSSAGAIEYIRNADSKPYALNDQSEKFPMFAVAVLTWGNGSIGADDTTVYLTPNFQNAAAGTDPATVALLRLATQGKLHSISVSQIVDNEAIGTLTYTLFSAEHGDTSITIDIAANAPSASSVVLVEPYIAMDGLAIRVDKTADVTNLPTNVVVMVYYEQEIP